MIDATMPPSKTGRPRTFNGTPLLLLLDPSKLANPDLDLRYLIADLLTERTGGAVQSDGYDYDDQDRLVIFLKVDDVDRWLASITSTLQHETLLGNDLGSIVVTVER